MSIKINDFCKWFIAICFGISEASQLWQLYLYLQSGMQLSVLATIMFIGMGCCVMLLSSMILYDNIEKVNNSDYKTSYHKQKKFWEFCILVASLAASLAISTPVLEQPHLLPFVGGNLVLAAILAAASFTVFYAMFSSEISLKDPDLALDAETEAKSGEENGLKVGSEKKYTKLVDLMAIISIFTNIWVLCCTLGVGFFPGGVATINLFMLSKIAVCLGVLAVNSAYRYVFCRRVAKECYNERFDKILPKNIIGFINLMLSAGLAFFSYHICVTNPFISLGWMTVPLAIFIGVIGFFMSLLGNGNFLVKSAESTVVTQKEGKSPADSISDRFYSSAVVFSIAIIFATEMHKPIILVFIPMVLYSWHFLNEEYKHEKVTVDSRQKLNGNSHNLPDQGVVRVADSYLPCVAELDGPMTALIK